MLRTLLIVNWRSTLLGVIAALYTLLPDLQKWVDQTAHVTPMAVIGIITSIIAVLTREKPSTEGMPPAAPVAVPAILIAAAMLALAAPVSAQQAIQLSSVSERTHVSLNGGAIVLTTGSDWSGASLGGGIGYNLHPKLTLFYGYDHGFPINNVDKHLDFSRAVASVRVHPNAFVGFGYGWFGDHVDGGLLQLAITKPVAKRLELAAAYSHVFADNTLDDFEYVKVCLNYHLLGKE